MAKTFDPKDSPSRPMVIAHRAASGYLPEHTLQGVAYAHATGAQFIEPDVVLSKDGVPVILHDIHIDTTTDAATRFPSRKRSDGRFYAIDFTLAEIKSLRVHERVTEGEGAPVFPHRFPQGASAFVVPTLGEYIELVQGLNHTTGHRAGIYPEIKEPAFHLKAGQDITAIVYKTLVQYGYNEHPNEIFVQCFEPATLKRLRHDFKTKMPLIQLIDDVESSDWFPQVSNKEQLAAALKDISTYADGVGPSLHLLMLPQGEQSFQRTDFSRLAKISGLLIHPYTVRTDALPSYMSSLTDLLDELYREQKVDAVFTDFSDQVLAYLTGLVGRS